MATASLTNPLGRVERRYAMRGGYHITVLWSNKADHRRLPDGYNVSDPIPIGADVRLIEGKVVPA